MIIGEVESDLFESTAQTLVCPVNTVGTMGKGLARRFKLTYPALERAYQRACDKDVFKREGIFVYTVHGEQVSGRAIDQTMHLDRKILCMPTKRHWRWPSKLEWIDEALEVIARDWHACGITSLAIPAVGCGEGGLPWEYVRELIYLHLDPVKLPAVIHLPWVQEPEETLDLDAAIHAEA